MPKRKISKESTRTASLVAGISLLGMALLAAYARFGVLKRITIEGNLTHTAYNFSNSIGSVRLAIACFLAVAALDVAVALSLFRILSRSNARLAKLMALLRILYAGGLTIAILQLVRISLARGGSAYASYVASNFGGDYIMSIERSINNFHAIWNASLILFGLHLILLGYLIFGSTFMPKILGLVVSIAGLGYLLDSLATIYLPKSVNFSYYTFVGEILLMLCLIVYGVRSKPLKNPS